MTVDVESFSIPLNKCDFETGRKVYKIGLPSLLDLFAKYDIKATFYFTGEMVKMFPESIEVVIEHDHEIGCHGYDHTPDRAFDILSYDEQVKELMKAKKVIESIAGRIKSFRAPMLRINEDTVKALESTGFLSDSSICSQRFDGFLTFGSRRKLKWLFAPRKPYFLSYNSIIKKGESKVLEIPISAAIVPYIGTTMRIFPRLIKIIQKFIFMESKRAGKPVVFLFHPNECLEVDTKIVTTKRTNNIFEYVLADYIRQRLKLRNLGKIAIRLLDDLLREAKKESFEFLSVYEYRKMYGRSI